jgi:hypothetical protein
LATSPPGYHCLKADLRAGKTENNVKSKSIWGKVGEKIFFDLDTNSIHQKPIVRYEVDFNNDFTFNFITEIGCSTALTTCGFPIPTFPCSGMPKDLNYNYTIAGVYRVWARIYDEGCNTSDDWIDVTIENL